MEEHKIPLSVAIMQDKDIKGKSGAKKGWRPSTQDAFHDKMVSGAHNSGEEQMIVGEDYVGAKKAFGVTNAMIKKSKCPKDAHFSYKGYPIYSQSPNQKLDKAPITVTLNGCAHFGNDQATSAFSRGRMTTEYFNSHLPKIRPDTHDVYVQGTKFLTKSPGPITFGSNAKGKPNPTAYWLNSKPSTTCYGSSHGSFLYTTQQHVKASSKVKLLEKAKQREMDLKLRPYTGYTKATTVISEPKQETIKPICIPPQTSQLKRRTSDMTNTTRIMRLSTPQTAIEKRPDSRYNKTTLCAGLNNGRDKSPDYRVPIIPMRFHECTDQQAILPSCWQHP